MSAYQEIERLPNLSQVHKLDRLITEPYMFVPQEALVEALGHTVDTPGNRSILWAYLSRLREQHHKRVLAVYGTRGVCLVPTDAPEEFAVHGFRSMPETVSLLPGDQRQMCEQLWSHLPYVRLDMTRTIVGTLTPLIAYGVYDTLVTMVSAIASSEHHSVSWLDVYPLDILEDGTNRMNVTICRLNSFMSNRKLLFKLKLTHREKYHYSFQTI